MARISFKPYRIASAFDTSRINSALNGELMIEDYTGIPFFKHATTGELLGPIITKTIDIPVGPTRTYTTVNLALDSIKNRRIGSDTYVTITLDAGVHLYSGEGMSFAHLDGQNVIVRGATPDYKTIVGGGTAGAITAAAGSGLANAAGVAGNWGVWLNLSDISGISVGDWVIVHRTVASSEYRTIVEGAWQVILIDTANKAVAVRNTARVTAFPSVTLTGGIMTVMKTVYKAAPAGTASGQGGTGAVCRSGVHLKDIMFDGTNAAANSIGIYTGRSSADQARSNGYMILGGSIGVSGYSSNVTSDGRAVTLWGRWASGADQRDVLAVSNAVYNGISVNYGGSLIGATHMALVCSGNGETGMHVGWGSYCHLVNNSTVGPLVFSGNKRGAIAHGHAHARLGYAWFEGNTVEHAYATQHAFLSFGYLRMYGSGGVSLAAYVGGYIELFGGTNGGGEFLIKYSGSTALHADRNSMIVGTGYSLTIANPNSYAARASTSSVIHFDYHPVITGLPTLDSDTIPGPSRVGDQWSVNADINKHDAIISAGSGALYSNVRYFIASDNVDLVLTDRAAFGDVIEVHTKDKTGYVRATNGQILSGVANGGINLLRDSVYRFVFGGSVSGWQVDTGAMIYQNMQLEVGPGKPHATVGAAMQTLLGKRIAPECVVILQLTAGVHGYDGEAVSVNHPDGHRIVIRGATPDVKEILPQVLSTANGSVTGSSRNWRVWIALNNVDGISVGDVVNIHGLRGGKDGEDYFALVGGCWQVSAVDADNKKIKIIHTGTAAYNTAINVQLGWPDVTLSATFSNQPNIAGQCTVFKTVYRPNSTNAGAGIVCRSGARIENLALLCRVVGNNSDDQTGALPVDKGDGIVALNSWTDCGYVSPVYLKNVGVNGFSSGISVFNARQLIMLGDYTDASPFNITAANNKEANGSTRYSNTAVCASGNWYHGIAADSMTVVLTPGGLRYPDVVANGNGKSGSGSGIRFDQSSVGYLQGHPDWGNNIVTCGNAAHGIIASNNSGVYAVSHISEFNGDYGVNSSRGSAVTVDYGRYIGNKNGVGAGSNGVLNLSGILRVNQLKIARNWYNGVVATERGVAMVHNGMLYGNYRPSTTERGGQLKLANMSIPGRDGMPVTPNFPKNTISAFGGISFADLSWNNADTEISATKISANTDAGANGTFYVVTANNVELKLPANPTDGMAYRVWAPTAIAYIDGNGKKVNFSTSKFRQAGHGYIVSGVYYNLGERYSWNATPSALLYMYTYDAANENWTITNYERSYYDSSTRVWNSMNEVGTGAFLSACWRTVHNRADNRTFYLPSQPADGDTIELYRATTGTTTIKPNGLKLDGVTDDKVLSTNGKFTFVARDWENNSVISWRTF